MRSLNRWSVIGVAAIILVLLFMWMVLTVDPCQAGWCYGGSCWSSRDCGRGCACMKTGGNTTGSCVSFDRSEWKFISPEVEQEVIDNPDSELSWYIQDNYMLREVE